MKYTLLISSYLATAVGAGSAGWYNAELFKVPDECIEYTTPAYPALITSVYDGDTVTADINLGFGMVLHDEKLRLYRINAPEVRGAGKAEGIKTRDWLAAQIDKQVVGITIQLKKNGREKRGKYGRPLVELYWEGENMNDALVAEGLAIYKEY